MFMKKRLLIVISILIIALILLLLGIKILDLIHYKCIFRYFFNFYCAGCGTTRMIKALLKFKIYKAFMYNPVMFILLIIITIYAIYSAYVYVKIGKVTLPKLKTIIIVIIILFIYMFVRNIPAFEFLRT